MSKVALETMETVDFVPGHGNEQVTVELELPPNLSCDGQRETNEGWAATFRYFDRTAVLRERRKGTIECEADFIARASGRERTGTNRKAEAIEWLYPRIKDAHIQRQTADHTGAPTVAEPEKLRLSGAVALLRNKDLVPGLPESDVRRGYELVLDLAVAVWNDDPLVHALSGSHVQKMYKARAIGFGEGPLTWPAELGYRKPLPRVRPQTVQGDLLDLSTLFGKLQGEADAKGKRFLLANPLERLDIGDYGKRVLPEAGLERYRWVLAVAAMAEEKLSEQGYRYTERRKYKGEWRTYNRVARFPNLIPGMLRHMLVTQQGHGNRPNGWLHIAVPGDVARTLDETYRALSSLRLEDHDEPIPAEWARIWIHGVYIYRREYFKGRRGRRYERGVPLSGPMGAEHDRYMDSRNDWLLSHGAESPWLFPSPRDPADPISDDDARLMLECADEVARQAVIAAGLNPVEIVPELTDTAWYAYRRAWKTYRNGLGWEANKNAAYAGGWTTRSGAIADTIYARFNPWLVLAVVEGKTLVEAIAQVGAVQELKSAIDVCPPPPPSLMACEGEKGHISPHPAHTASGSVTVTGAAALS